jgi:hypothetical protein
MSNHAVNEAGNIRTAPGSKEDMEGVIAQTRQICNAMTVVINEIHNYLVPRAAEFGVVLDAQAEHAWAMSAWITISRDSKAQYRMPPRRLGVANNATNPRPPKSPKSELFPRAEPPAAGPVPFSNPAMSPALAKLRQMLSNDQVEEEELLAILRESSPRQTLFLSRLDEIPARTAELCLQRWPVIVELVESMRADNGEAV